MPFSLPRFSAAVLAIQILAMLAFAASGARAAPAGLPLPFLAADFAPGGDPGYLSPAGMTVIGGKIYFSSSDPDHGEEPWVSDGSAAGTRRLADLCSGPCSSYARGFAALGDAVVVHANDHRGRRGIFRLANGEIHEIASFDSGIEQWAVLGSTYFFTIRSFSPRESFLYRTDGTPEGTRRVARLHLDPAHAPLQEMAAVNGAVYFADAGRLYRMTETDSEPQPVFDFGEGTPQPTAAEYTALDAGRFVFRACLPQLGQLRCRAWVSDGSAAGTRSLEAEADGEKTANATHFLAWRGRIYFKINPSMEPNGGIASTDGTPEGTRVELLSWSSDVFAATSGYLFLSAGNSLVARDAAGQERTLVNLEPFDPIGVIGDRLIFTYGEVGGSIPPRPGFSRLASTDGEPDGTFDLREGSADPGVRLGDVFYFGFSEPDGGGGLWRSDGSAAGTAEAVPAPEVPRSSEPRPFRAGAAVAAEAGTGERVYPPPRFLHRLDPATLSRSQVGDRELRVRVAGGGRVYATAGTGGEDAPSFSYDGGHLVELPFVERLYDGGAFTADGHAFFFSDAPSVGVGVRLWESDGSAAGTRIVDEIPLSFPRVVASGDFVFYQGLGGSRSWIGVWDRVRGEKRGLADGGHFLAGIAALPGGRALFRQRLYAPYIHEVFWRSDGSVAGTQAFLDYPAAEQVLISAAAGNRFYLVLPAISGDVGHQGLWAGDLSDAGVRQVVPTADRRFRELVPAGDRLYFVAESASGRELGFTDGSAAGTRFFDLRPGPESSMPQALHVLDDQRLVFAASGDEAGLELWISDGTASGTYRLTDLNPGDAASSPSDFLEAGGRLFFQASDGEHGRELWGLDLPPARPSCPADLLCLQNDRFLVKVKAHAHDGDFAGRRALAGAESGVFTFFSEANWELLVKVLDGCGVNGAFWVFAAAPSEEGYTLEVEDRASGLSKTWESPAGAARPILDTGAFASCALPAPEPVHSPARPPAGFAGRCPLSEGGRPDLCLGPGGRFRASLEHYTANGSGPALPVADGSADSGIFTFFSPTNWEMMVKVLDGCAINGNFWAFAAGTTDVGWGLTLEDRFTGARKTYGNPSSHAAPALVDLGAFACD